MGQKRDFYLTEEGLEKIKREYEILKKNRFLDNGDGYGELNLIELKLTELDNILKSAVLIKPPSQENGGAIGLGAKVRVEGNNQEYDFELVGSLEADPSRGKISNESPVGAALLNRCAGDEVTICSPFKKIIYKIKEVKYGSQNEQ